MATATASRENPYLEMFGYFRDELDEHHDRRERVIKASRDITALSKKMYQTRSSYFEHKTPTKISVGSLLSNGITTYHHHLTRIR